MNLRRGLIRLWVLGSAIWIVGVVIVAAYDPKLYSPEQDRWAAYTIGAPSQQPAATVPAPTNWWQDPKYRGGAAPAAAPKTFSFEEAMSQFSTQDGAKPAQEEWWKADQSAPAQVASSPEPDATARQVDATEIRNILSKYAEMAFGLPIILLALGMGVGWVVTGFKSGQSRGR